MHGLMMDTPLLVTEIMRHAERNNPKGEVVSVTADAPRHRCTYADVIRRTHQLANALRAAGVREGDRIGTLAWNDYRHLELYFAVSCMGAVLHTVNPRLFPEQVEYIINHGEDQLSVRRPDAAAAARAARGQAADGAADDPAHQRSRDAGAGRRGSARVL